MSPVCNCTDNLLVRNALSVNRPRWVQLFIALLPGAISRLLYHESRISSEGLISLSNLP